MLDDIFLGFRVISSFLLNLSLFKIKSIKNYKTRFRGIVGQIWRIYILSIIKVINPKVVITLIDNHPVFHWLCEHYNGAELMAVQNGNRTKVEFRDLKTPFKIQHFFCFGDYEKDIYSDMGFIIDHYYPVGSLLGGYYTYGNKNNIEIKYDICVLSNWRGNICNTIDVQTTMESTQKLDRFLSRYIREYNLNTAISLRSEPGSPDRNIPVYGNEKDYFNNIYPENVDLIDPNFEERNIYNNMAQSDLIISFGSTPLREAFGWGKKILYCDFTGTKQYNDYDPIILFRDENYDLFKKRLNEMRYMSAEEYKDKTKEYASYLMNNNPSCPPHIFIRQKIDFYLGK